MREAIEAYPLCWPAGWRRTEPQFRTRAKFGKRGKHPNYSFQTLRELTVAQATDRVLDQLQLMGVQLWNSVVVSTNLKVRKTDGLPMSNQRLPEDPGVAVYWTTNEGEDRCMAIDIYDRVQGNLGAIAATLEAMRSIERHGGSEILNRAFTGFVALPDLSQEPWYSILGFASESDAIDGDFEKAARRLMRKFHPDTGEKPDNWQFARVKKARDEGREHV